MESASLSICNLDDARFLKFDEPTIRHIAYMRLGRKSLLTLVLDQAFYEHLARFRTHLSFRSRQNEGVRRAYCAMTLREFEGVNARQRWANWRTIPRNLSGQVPRARLNALDLCCGVGHSTEVLGCYLAPGSRILGLEYNSDFVSLARARVYRTMLGQRADVSFRAQSVLETFRDENGHVLAPESIDLVNSSGAVAYHFDKTTTEKLATEVARVVIPGGVAMIDSGRSGTDRQTLLQIFDRLGFSPVHETKSCFADSALQICFKKRL